MSYVINAREVWSLLRELDSYISTDRLVLGASEGKIHLMLPDVDDQDIREKLYDYIEHVVNKLRKKYDFLRFSREGGAIVILTM